ncbi:DUF7269 family protein [Halorubellus litoreus]|uniref:Uncharacterized protein n=1 Tax=Halorubellus litoreus TaxID=755308 RepID=A0ABD5VNN7_9EURY
MKRWRVLASGLGLVVLGAAITGVGTSVAASATEALVGLLGNDYLVAAAVAALALAVTVPVAVSARASALDQATMPTPEATLAMPRPGETVDEALESGVAFVPYVSRDRKEAVRQEVRRTAVDVVARRDSCSRDDARERVADGSWTSDEAAAAFLATDDAPSRDVARSDGVGAYLGALAHGDTLFQRRARRTTAVIAGESSTDPSSDHRTGTGRDEPRRETPERATATRRAASTEGSR